MTKLTVISFNARGLNLPYKRTSFLDVLRSEGVDIALVSESHLLQKDVHKLQNNHYAVKTNASALNKTKGVVIVVRRNFQVTNLGVGCDSEGRITFMKTRKLHFYLFTHRTPLILISMYVCPISCLTCLITVYLLGQTLMRFGTTL